MHLGESNSITIALHSSPGVACVCISSVIGTARVSAGRQATRHEYEKDQGQGGKCRSSLLTQSGSGWTGYWGSGGFPTTAGRGRRSLSARWNGGEGRNWGRSSNRSSEAGVWVAKRLGRNCWRRPWSGWAPAITVRNVQAAGEVRAEGLVRAGLAALGWTERELCGRAQGDRGKVKLARQLRAETTMTLRWIVA